MPICCNGSQGALKMRCQRWRVSSNLTIGTRLYLYNLIVINFNMPLWCNQVDTADFNVFYLLYYLCYKYCFYKQRVPKRKLLE